MPFSVFLSVPLVVGGKLARPDGSVSQFLRFLFQRGSVLHLLGSTPYFMVASLPKPRCFWASSLWVPFEETFFCACWPRRGWWMISLSFICSEWTIDGGRGTLSRASGKMQISSHFTFQGCNEDVRESQAALNSGGRFLHYVNKCSSRQASQRYMLVVWPCSLRTVCTMVGYREPLWLPRASVYEMNNVIPPQNMARVSWNFQGSVGHPMSERERELSALPP